MKIDIPTAYKYRFVKSQDVYLMPNSGVVAEQC